MGLKISSIAQVPVSTDRDYFVYFLDYGWDEPLAQALYDNIDKMAVIASENRGLIIHGLHREHFANEVLSWHGINGEDAAGILPAIMITNTEPRKIAEANKDFLLSHKTAVINNPIKKMIVIPLKKLCKSPSDVVNLLSKIENDMKNKKTIDNFEVKKLIDKTNIGLAEMVILKPSVAGFGIDLVKAYQFGKKYWLELKQKKSIP